jgi:OOP family OmpA-OmpF porin
MAKGNRSLRIGLLSCSALSAFAILSVATSAQAQEEVLNRFDSAVAGDTFFSVFGPGVGGHLVGRGLATFDYGNRPYVLKNAAGDELAALSRSQTFVHLGGSLALWDRLLVSLDLPIAVDQRGDDVRIGSSRINGSNGPGLGDLRVGLRGRIWGQATDPFAVGVGGFVFVPTGTDAWTGAGHIYGEPQVLLGGRVPHFTYSAFGGVRLRPSEDPTSLTFGVGAAALLLDETLTIGPEFRGSHDLTSPDLAAGLLARGGATSAEVRLGAQYRFLDRFVVGAAGGVGVASAIGTPDFRLLARLAFDPRGETPPPADADKDGIPDEQDACIDRAGPPSAEPTMHGCPPPPPEPERPSEPPPPPPPPPPPADQDGDGVPDSLDACFMVAGVASPDPTKNGCPSDQDGDGYVDASDACPNLAGSAPDGCPDRDGDTVKDRVDECPDQAGIVPSGCPDADADGLVDPKDACPNVRGEAHTDPSKNGCPRVTVKSGAIELVDPIEFEEGRAALRESSSEILSSLALFLKEQADILMVEVQGHTEEGGTSARAQALSASRARSVVDALTARGVERKRMTPVGFGFDRPLVKRGSPDAAKKNNRVQFLIMKRASTAAPATPAKPMTPATPAKPMAPATPAKPMAPATPAKPMAPATPAPKK